MASDGGKGKDPLDPYGDADDILDYGDFDLESDLLDADIAAAAAAGTYDDLDLESEDILAIDEAVENGAAANVEVKAKESPTTQGNGTTAASSSVGGVSKENNNLGAKDPSKTDKSVPTRDTSGFQESKKGDFRAQQESNRSQLDNFQGEHSRQLSGTGRGSPGAPRGRGGQGYMGMGRGNFQGGRGMGHYPMMPMGMGMPVGMGMGMGMNRGMAPNMNMGMNMGMGMGMGMNMNMNMNMGMNMGMMDSMHLGMNNPRFPGNQGMNYPYGGSPSMSGGMMNQGMTGMNPRGPQGNKGAPGRTIHINPNFQKRTGVSPIPGMGGAPQDQQHHQSPQYPQQQRPQYQDSDRQLRQTSSRDDFNGDDGIRRNQSYPDRDGTRTGNQGPVGSASSVSDRGDQSTGDNYRTPTGSNSGDRDKKGRRLSDAGRSMSLDSPGSSLSARSHSPLGKGSSGSISSRLSLGVKRSGEELGDSNKTPKSNGSSTPRSEQMRSANTPQRELGSVSFLRDKSEPVGARRDMDNGPNAVAKGFVKMENVPECVSDASIRKLADGISGVGRVLSISKLDNRALKLGFASMEEAKFFRRQINRTTVEGSLVTVTLASS
ncbi:hypothetical protein BG011_003860 [Mortierella polycephala]|uniref:RRM domain-containing protein n=1 Tax=Mortierella polycephala TaxID=41804 RepID=A0A9P6U2G2_9FUNG|nr:hypothetical protein BG011_003860 [Mortierella polycephala]